MLELFFSILFFPFLLGVIVLVIIGAIRRPPFTIQGRWQTFLDGLQLPAMEFYASVKAGLLERQIPNVSLSEESFLERHILSAKRYYLRVSKHEYIYYIGITPYGTGTFISSWQCVKEETVMNHIPVISKLLGLDRKRKTFYQMDTETMFRSLVHATVIETVSTLSEAKGYRGLTELEKQFTELR